MLCSTVKFWEFFVCSSRCLFLVRYVVSRYFCPVSSWSFLLRAYSIEQNFKFWQKSHVPVFSFIDCAFVVKLRNSWLHPKPRRFPPIFFLKDLGFYILHGHEVHDQFWIRCEVWVQVHFLPIHVQLLQSRLLKRLSFLHWFAFTSLLKISWTFLCESISGFSVLFCSVHLFVYFSASIAQSWLLFFFIIYSFLFKIVLAILRSSFAFHIHFRINLSVPIKKIFVGVFW